MNILINIAKQNNISENVFKDFINEENKTFNKSNVERFINYHKKKLRS